MNAGMEADEPDNLRKCLDFGSEELFVAVPGLYGVICSTSDGNPVTQRFHDQMEADRLAAMSSSLVALGETMAKASRQRESEFVIVQSVDGYIVSLRIGQYLLLSAMARRDTNLGMLLSNCRNAAERIRGQLGEDVGKPKAEEK